MKKAIFIFSVIMLSMTGFTQNNPAKTNSHPNTISTVNFLKPIENTPGYLSLNTRPKWNVKLFNDEYNQLLAINKKKELYPILLVDNRFLNQATPTRYSSQNYMWVSTEPKYKTFAGSVANDIITSFVNSKTKKHGLNFKVAEKGYYTPVGTKY